VTLVDTAGLRETDGVVEREGIRRAEQRGRQADLILWAVEPGGVDAMDPKAGLPADMVQTVPVWTVRTKSDLETLPEQDSSGTTKEFPASIRSRDGTKPLFDALTRFAEETISLGETPLATRARHRHYLEECLSGLHQAVSAHHLPAELRAEDLRRAADSLGRITGRIDVEDLLDVIFRDFCIGK